MTSVSITCPNCEKILRPKARPPEGKKVKCPVCNEVFLPEVQEEETAIQQKPKGNTKLGANGKIQAHKPTALGKKTTALGGKKSRDDDAPPVKKKKAAPAKSNKMLFIIGGVAAGGFLLLSLVLCGVGAFVWPGFLRSKSGDTKEVAGKKGNGGDAAAAFDMLAYVPANANVVAGANPKMLRAKMPTLEPMLTQQINKGPDAPPAEFINLFVNSERLLVFGNTAEKSIHVMVEATATDVKAVKASKILQPAKTVGGHANVHKMNPKRPGDPSDYIVFVNDTCVLISEAPEKNVIAVLDRGKKPGGTPGSVVALAKPLEKSTFWLAMNIDEAMRKNLQRGAPKPNPNMPKSFQDASAAINNLTSVTLAADIADAEVKWTGTASFNNPNDPSKVKQAVDDGVNLLRVILPAMLAQQGKGPAKGPDAAQLQKSITEVLNSVNCTTQGSMVTLRLSVRLQVLTDLAVKLK